MNKKLYLSVRVIDAEGKYCINTSIQMFFIKDNTTEEGEVIRNFVTELKVEPYGMLFWPMEIVHIIGTDSPLSNLTPATLNTKK